MNTRNSTAAHDHIPSTEFFIVLILFISLLIIAGIIGNVGVIAYNILVNHSKTPTTYFVVNLAISDIIVCLIFFPTWLIESILIIGENEGNPRLTCKVGVTSSAASMALSVANLLAITIDKYILITKPLKYSSIMTWKRTHIMLAVIWLLVIVNVNLVFFGVDEVPGRRLSCRTNYMKNIFVVTFNIPIVILLYLNHKIFEIAKVHRRKIIDESSISSYASDITSEQNETTTSGRRKRMQLLQQLKVVKTFVLVVGVFLVCIIPSTIVYIIRKFYCNDCVPTSVTLVFGMLVGANSVINPFIHSLRNKQYRIAYRQFFCRFCNIT